MLAPASEPVFVIDPAAHSAQSLASSEPSDSTYRPAAQSIHAATLDAVEYLPAVQSEQAADCGPLYFPAGQLLQLAPCR